MSALTTEDYKTVLKYYEKNIPTDKIKLKQIAEDIIAQKLCNCIKKINNTHTEEPKSIGICKNSVLKNLKVPPVSALFIDLSKYNASIKTFLFYMVI